MAWMLLAISTVGLALAFLLFLRLRGTLRAPLQSAALAFVAYLLLMLSLLAGIAGIKAYERGWQYDDPPFVIVLAVIGLLLSLALAGRHYVLAAAREQGTDKGQRQ